MSGKLPQKSCYLEKVLIKDQTFLTEYAIIPRTMEQTLSKSCLLLFSHLRGIFDSKMGSVCIPTTPYLAKSMGKSERQIYRYLKVLRDRKLIDVHTTPLKRDKFSGRYYKQRDITPLAKTDTVKDIQRVFFNTKLRIDEKERKFNEILSKTTLKTLSGTKIIPVKPESVPIVPIKENHRTSIPEYFKKLIALEQAAVKVPIPETPIMTKELRLLTDLYIKQNGKDDHAILPPEYPKNNTEFIKMFDLVPGENYLDGRYDVDGLILAIAQADELMAITKRDTNPNSLSREECEAKTKLEQICDYGEEFTGDTWVERLDNYLKKMEEEFGIGEEQI